MVQRILSFVIPNQTFKLFRSPEYPLIEVRLDISKTHRHNL